MIIRPQTREEFTTFLLRTLVRYNTVTLPSSAVRAYRYPHDTIQYTPIKAITSAESTFIKQPPTHSPMPTHPSEYHSDTKLDYDITSKGYRITPHRDKHVHNYFILFLKKTPDLSALTIPGLQSTISFAVPFSFPSLYVCTVQARFIAFFMPVCLSVRLQDSTYDNELLPYCKI